MSRKSKAEYIAEKRRAYSVAGSKRRTRILDDTCDLQVAKSGQHSKRGQSPFLFLKRTGMTMRRYRALSK